MTTEAQKQTELGYVELFRRGQTDWVEVVPGEKPDFRIRRSSGAEVGLEVVEYHADQSRVAQEARWWKSLWPLVERGSQLAEDLRGVGVIVQFNEGQVPARRDHEALARELVGVARAAAARGEAEVVFAPRSTSAEASRLVPDYFFLPQEDWPLASKHLSLLRVSSSQIRAWLPWTCLEVAGAWVGPDEDEFKRILEGKTKKAQKYDLGGVPLWLLVVCETQGDLESHVFPRDDHDLAALEAKVRGTSFDFVNRPFAEVWLLSAFDGNFRRLHPPHAG